MGYYTRYSLKVTEINGDFSEQEDDIISVLRKENEDAKFAIYDSGYTKDSCKWYDNDNDMRKFSKKYPDKIFILSGKGEENEDMWKKYFIDGKMADYKAIITYPYLRFSDLS